MSAITKLDELKKRLKKLQAGETGALVHAQELMKLRLQEFRLAI